MPLDGNRPGPRCTPQAARTLRDVAGRLREVADDPAAMAALAGAAADVLAATATAWERGQGGPLTRAAELLDRAAHEPERRHPVRRGSTAYALRAMARLVTLMGEPSGDQAAAEAMRLVLELAVFAETLAELREARQRLHRADAARAAAAALRSYTPTSVSSPTGGISRHTATAPSVWREVQRTARHGR